MALLGLHRKRWGGDPRGFGLTTATMGDCWPRRWWRWWFSCALLLRGCAILARMDRRGVIAGSAATLLLALAGCSPASEPGPIPRPTLGRPSNGTTPSTTTTPSSEPTPDGDGLRQPWTFVTVEGGRGTFTVPSETTSLIERIEAVRKESKGDRIYYVVVDVDNRGGVGTLSLDRLTIRDNDGETYDSTPQDDVIERWKLPGGKAARDRLITLQEDMTPAVPAGERQRVVKIFADPIRSISRSFVYVGGGLETTEAYPS